MCPLRFLCNGVALCGTGRDRVRGRTHARGMGAGRALPAAAGAPSRPAPDGPSDASYANFDICAFLSS